MDEVVQSENTACCLRITNKQIPGTFSFRYFEMKGELKTTLYATSWKVTGWSTE
jgi:hypothetical protein